MQYQIVFSVDTGLSTEMPEDTGQVADTVADAAVTAREQAIALYKLRKMQMRAARKKYTEARKLLSQLDTTHPTTCMPDGQFAFTACLLMLTDPDARPPTPTQKSVPKKTDTPPAKAPEPPAPEPVKKMRKRTRMWLAVSADEYELPLAYGYTLEQLAKRMGVSKSVIDKKFRGKTRNELAAPNEVAYSTEHSHFFVRCVPLDDGEDISEDVEVS